MSTFLAPYMQKNSCHLRFVGRYAVDTAWNLYSSFDLKDLNLAAL